MCIIVLAKPNKRVSRKILSNCQSNNPDGIGYAYVDISGSHNLILRKPFFSFSNFYRSYVKDYKQSSGSYFLIHFRIATSGQLNKKNTHPHRVSPSLVLAHNGVLDKLGDNTVSDTVEFTKLCRKKYLNFRNPLTAFLLSEYFRLNGSKAVFLQKDNTVYIANERAGIWDSNIWYSNTTYDHDRCIGFTFLSSSRKKKRGTSWGDNGWDYLDMDKATCPHCNHVYDPDIYTRCPYCY